MPDKTLRTGTRRNLAEWLLCAVLLLNWGGYLGYSKHQDYDQITFSEQNRLSNQALVIEKNLTSQLLSANRVLEGLLIELARGPSNRAGASTLKRDARLLVKVGPGERHGSISACVATWLDSMAGLESPMKASDSALYVAKPRGRNCVATAQPA